MICLLPAGWAGQGGPFLYGFNGFLPLPLFPLKRTVAMSAPADQPDYPLLLRRMQFLDLVQRVARMDVDACAQTVGLEALSFHSRMFHSDVTAASLFKSRKQLISASRAIPQQTHRQPLREEFHYRRSQPVRVVHQQTTDDSDEAARPRRQKAPSPAGLVLSSPETKGSRASAKQKRPIPHGDDSETDDACENQPQNPRTNLHPSAQTPQTQIPLEVLRMVGGIVKEMRQQQEPPRPPMYDRAVSPPSPRGHVAVGVETDHDAMPQAQSDAQSHHHTGHQFTRPIDSHAEERERDEHRNERTEVPSSRPILRESGVDPRPIEVAVETDPPSRHDAAAAHREQPQAQRRGSKREQQGRQPQQQSANAVRPMKSSEQQQQLEYARRGKGKKNSNSKHPPFPPLPATQFQQLVGSIAADMAAAEEADAADFSRSEALLSAVAAASAMISEVDEMLHSTEGSADGSASPVVPPRWTGERKSKAAAGFVPSHVVERILASRAESHELQRYNERLYNTSSVSQYVFADRATNAILEDLVEEVLDEVAQLCDEFVDGLAQHELQ